jgi:hypothetical protein
MTGFGVDIGQLGSIAGKVSDIGDSLTGIGGDLGNAEGGDFGHPELNQVISQVSSMFGQHVSGLGQHVGGMAGNLQSVAQSYAGSDGTNADLLGGVDVPGFPGNTAAGSGDSGSSDSGSNDSGPFGLGPNPLLD